MISTNLSYKVSRLDNEEWHNILDLFEDANIYQTNEFTKYSKGGENYEHFIVEKNNEIIAAAIVRIKILPIIKRGIAYVRFGPMWQKKSEKIGPSILDKTLKLLYKEYAVKRKLVLRIMSNLTLEKDSELVEIYKNLGYKKISKSSQTILLDLTKNQKDIRANFKRSWRKNLNKSEKNNLKVTKGKCKKDYQIFKSLYKEMHQRKQFKEFVSINDFQKIFDELTEKNWVQIYIAYFGEKPVTAYIFSSIGTTTYSLLSASVLNELKHNASYLINWLAILDFKENGKTTYDLTGVDKNTNPGVFNFKSGMEEKVSKYFGVQEIYNSKLSKLIIYLAEKAK